ncbi:MAG: A/G-specific adenine glycosylase [Nanoarchaeota archaeon]|mgnify:CR=1 FL=1
MTDIPKIQKTILNWYKQSGRQLPWRQTTDPYKILVSEMMLQQTQVDRVIPKYYAFLEKFPTVNSLANAPTADVLTMWSGLGYNRRALYLQKCAQAIKGKYDGKFPETTEELLALPGLGKYTVAAVQSFANNKDIVVIDVNIERIFKRIFYGKIESAEAIAQHILPKNESRNWHNALMDIGALFCTAKNPRCDICPVKQFCTSANNKERIEATWKKKNVVPFKESDRIVRGTILKMLTTQNGQDKNAIYEQLLQRNIKREKEKFEEIIAQLEKDGLVKKEQKILSLP